jgi:hypothetical protein
MSQVSSRETFRAALPSLTPCGNVGRPTPIFTLVAFTESKNFATICKKEKMMQESKELRETCGKLTAYLGSLHRGTCTSDNQEEIK